MTRQPGTRATEEPDGERRRAAQEIADRLRRDGVPLTGRETDEELVSMLEAVELFESAVEQSGGDLMVDEPVGASSPIAPDNRAFVLPKRLEHETVASFIGRIAEATARAAEVRGGS